MSDRRSESFQDINYIVSVRCSINNLSVDEDCWTEGAISPEYETKTLRGEGPRVNNPKKVSKTRFCKYMIFL